MKVDIDYYSVYCNEYEKGNFTGDDVLSEVRKLYFSDKKKYKDRFAKKMYGVVHHYMYCIEPQKPMQWKKMVEGKVLERSKVGENFYEIISKDVSNNIFKISKFDFEHNWIETKYFSQLCKHFPAMIIYPIPEDEKLLVKEFDKHHNKAEEYFLLPSKTNNEDEFITSIPKIICETSCGELLFFKMGQENSNIQIDEKEKVNFMENKKIIEDNGLEKRIYFGELKNDLRHGHGRLVSMNGRTVFEGSYLNDKKNGEGVSFYKNGKICYAGYFKDGMKQGIGVSFKSDGELVHISKWESDVPSSRCSTFDTDGNLLFTGNIVNGKKDGFCFVYDKSGRVLAGIWKEGEFLGSGTVYNKDGKIEASGKIDNEVLKDFLK